MFDNLQPIVSWTWTWISGPMAGQSDVVTTPNCIIRPPQAQGASAPSHPTIAFRVTPQGLLLQCQAGEVLVNGHSESNHLLQDGDVVQHGEFSARITFARAETPAPFPQKEPLLEFALVDSKISESEEIAVTSQGRHEPGRYEVDQLSEDRYEEAPINANSVRRRANVDSLEQVLINQPENQELNQKLLATFNKFRQIAKQVPDCRIAQQLEILRSVDLIDHDLDMLDSALKALVHSSQSSEEIADRLTDSRCDLDVETESISSSTDQLNREPVEYTLAAKAYQGAEELAADALQAHSSRSSQPNQDFNSTGSAYDERDSSKPSTPHAVPSLSHEIAGESLTHDHTDSVDDATHEQNAPSLREVLARLQVDSVSSVELNLKPNQRQISNSVLLAFDSSETSPATNAQGNSLDAPVQQESLTESSPKWVDVPVNKSTDLKLEQRSPDNDSLDEAVDMKPRWAELEHKNDEPQFPEDSVVKLPDSTFQANGAEEVNQLLCKLGTMPQAGNSNSSDVEFSPETMSEIDSIRSKLEGVFKKSANASTIAGFKMNDTNAQLGKVPASVSNHDLGFNQRPDAALPVATTAKTPIDAPVEFSRFNPASFDDDKSSIDRSQTKGVINQHVQVPNLVEADVPENAVEERDESELIDSGVSEPKLEFTTIEKVQSNELVTAALMRNLYEDDDFSPEEKASPQKSRPSVPTQHSQEFETLAPSQPDGPSRSPATGEQDGENVNDYMNELMKRLRGGSGSYQAPVTTKTLVTPVFPSKVEVPAPVEEMIPLKESEYLPRQRAPERNANMDALRKLANDSTRDAVSSFANRQEKSTKAVRIGAIVGGTLMSAAFFAISRGFGDPASLGGLLSLMGTFAAIAFHVLAKAKQEEETHKSDSIVE